MFNIGKTAFLLCVNFIVSMICLICCANKSGYEFVFLFPMALSFAILLPNFRRLAKEFLGIKILYISMWVKYCIFPLSLSFSDKINGIGIEPNTTYITIASILNILELIVVALIVDVLGKKLLLNKEAEQFNKIDENIVYQRHILEWFVIILSLTFIAMHPDLLNNFSFGVFNEESKTISYFWGLDIRLIQISIILIFCMFTAWAKRRYLSSDSNIYFYLALMVGIVSMLVFKGENRASLLINILSVSTVLITAFPEFKKKIVKTITFTGVCAIIALSLYRMLAVTAWRPQGGSLDLSFNWLTKTIQGYLAGPRNIAQGLEAIHYHPSDLTTLISDVLVWTGYLGDYVSEKFGIQYCGTSYLYNQYIYGTNLVDSGDQIVSLVVQSIWHFGYIGSLFFSAIIACLIVVFDLYRCKADSLGKKYINTMMSVVTGLMFGYNVSIIMMYFMDRYFITWLIISASVLVAKKVRLWKGGL